jgi:hypothetical protein
MKKTLPLEIVNYILVYRPKHILATIYENEYLLTFNKKKYNGIFNIMLDELTGGINRANNFTLRQDDEDDDDDDYDDDYYDSEYSDDISASYMGLYTTDETLNSFIDEYDDYYNDYEDSEEDDDDDDDEDDDEVDGDGDNDEHWAYSNADFTVQLQGVNCKICGNYIVRLYYMRDNILCHHIQANHLF